MLYRIFTENINKKLIKIVDQKIYARVAPHHKLRLINTFKKKPGLVVAMTGDGVNDAPALKRADIGVAMGITGTDVAKEAADMILADDNFATIVAAIKKGREVYQNIKKYLYFLLQCNIGEVLALGGGFLFGFPPVLTAIQILWVNLATDGLPALALGVDQSMANIMEKKRGEEVFSLRSVILMGVIGINVALVLLPLFWFYSQTKTLMRTQTIVFATLVLMEMVNVYNNRETENSILTPKIFMSRWVNLAVIFSILTTVAIVQIPRLARLFQLEPLGLLEWIVAFGLSLSLLLTSEVFKVVSKFPLFSRP